MRFGGDVVSLSDLSSGERGSPFVPSAGDDLPTPHLTPQELAELRQSLLNRRNKLAGEIARLQNEACWLAGASERFGASQRAGGGITGAGAVWERALRLSSIAHKRSILHEIDRALGRIENNTYGRCTETNRVIPVTRLREIPWARCS